MSQSENIHVASFNSASYEWWGRNTLSSHGLEDAAALRAKLSRYHPSFFKKLVVIHSALVPASELAHELIGNRNVQTVASNRIAAVGDRPHAIESLEETVAQAYAEETGQQLSDDSIPLLIAPASLAGVIRGQRDPMTWGLKVPTNEFTIYEPGTWDPSIYDPSVEAKALEEFGLAPVHV